MKFQQHLHQAVFPLALNVQNHFVQIRACTIIKSTHAHCNVGNLFNICSSYLHKCK